MRNCIICHKPTEGSIGVAGIRWSCICQPCKNKEDNLLIEQLKAQSIALNMIFGASPKYSAVKEAEYIANSQKEK